MDPVAHRIIGVETDVESTQTGKQLPLDVAMDEDQS